MKQLHLSAWDKVRLLSTEPQVLSGLSFILIPILFLFLMEYNFSAIEFEIRSTDFVEGRVEWAEETNASYNDRRVRAYSFSYVIEGKRYQGKSYSPNYYQAGDRVMVEYILSKPKVARIKGMWISVFPLEIVAFLLIPLLIGIGVLYPPIANTLHNCRIIQNGRMIKGKLFRSVTARIWIGFKKLNKHTFEYEVDGKRYFHTYRSFDTLHMVYGGEAYLVYDRRDPAEAVMWYVLPESIRRKLREVFPGERI